MATTANSLTPDQRKVLEAARDHPSDNPPVGEVADSIDDPHIKTPYVERILHDPSFTLPPEGGSDEEPSADDEDNTAGDPLPDIDDESDEENADEGEFEGIDKAYEGVLKGPARQRQVLAILFCSPGPLVNMDLHAILGSSRTYIYQANKLLDPDLIEQLEENEEGSKPWSITEKGVAVTRRLAREHTEELAAELDPLVAITPDGEWNPDWREDLNEIDEVNDVREHITPPEDEDENESEFEKVEPGDPEPPEPDQPEEPDEQSTIAENKDVRSEIEEISEEEGKDAFICSLCEGDDPHTGTRFAHVQTHITQSKEGRHRGRHGSEPGVMEINHDLLDSISPRNSGHNGSCTTQMDFDKVLEDLADGGISGTPVAVEDQIETEIETETEGSGSEHEVTVSDEDGRPVLDGTSGGFQSVQDRPVRGRRNDQEDGDSSSGMHDGGPSRIGETLGNSPPDESSGDQDAPTMSDASTGPTETVSVPEPPAEDEETPFVLTSLTRDEAFELISSDAPESIRRKAFDAVADRQAPDEE